MTLDGPRVGIVSLGEAGNFGDDLILIAVVDAIYSRWPYASVSFLSFGQELDWDEIRRARGYSSAPRRIREKVELPLVRENNRQFEDCDVIVFGGGGLLQTSHSPDRPYEWLSYLPISPRSAVVLAVGLGLGPLTDEWTTRLARLGNPFDYTWVRDKDSLELATKQLGWSANECRDFVDEEFLRSFEGDGRRPASLSILGVALRAWPGLGIDEVATKVEDVARQHDCEEVEFFVLEANRGRGVDVDFSTAVADAVRLPTKVRVYDGRRMTDFLQRMLAVRASVSMKLHSSAIWGAASIPIHPIFYAPKISAFFGVPYRGLEISERALMPAKPLKEVPTAAVALVQGIGEALSRPARGSRFGARERFLYQIRRLFRATVRRLPAMRGRPRW